LIGPPGTGKSTLAHDLIKLIDADLVQTDAIRKMLVGQPTYGPAESAWVHRVAHQRMRQVLRHGRNVIFDATSLRKSHRRSLQRLAESVGCRTLMLMVWASESVVRARLLRRREVPDSSDKSDADWNVYQQLIRSFEPLDGPHIVINTTVDTNPILRRVVGLLDASA
jgi:predicted kinase